MLKDYYKQMSDELKEIKKEGKIEDIEIEEVSEENGYEEVDINYPMNRKFKASMLKKGIIATAAAVCLATGFSGVAPVQDNMSVVEAKAKKAKKDKKKPTIKFSGKSKITVDKNKSIRIPKTTAKDNKDGNVTKKIKITVKKGKKSYTKIAKAIKKNKKVKFTSPGKYVITYTVKDKAGNKSTKKRYVTVKNTKKNVTPTTETPTTEENKKHTVNPSLDYSKYDIKRVTVNGNEYNVSEDPEFSYRLTCAMQTPMDKITINVENDYDKLSFDVNTKLTENSQYLKYLGKITATDENGNDISDNIVIVEIAFLQGIASYYVISMYVEDLNGNYECKNIYIYLGIYNDNENRIPEDLQDENYELISSNPIVYAVRRKLTSDISLNESKKTKNLCYNNL